MFKRVHTNTHAHTDKESINILILGKKIDNVKSKKAIQFFIHSFLCLFCIINNQIYEKSMTCDTHTIHY